MTHLLLIYESDTQLVVRCTAVLLTRALPAMRYGQSVIPVAASANRRHGAEPPNPHMRPLAAREIAAILALSNLAPGSRGATGWAAA
jgi:hypothetical protein